MSFHLQGAQRRQRYTPGRVKVLKIDRGTTISAAKHNTGMLMAADSRVWSTSKIVRDYEDPHKMLKVGTHIKYMLYAGSGVSLTTKMAFRGLQLLAKRKQSQGTVLSAKEGILYAKKLLGWNYKNLRHARQSCEARYAQVMLASYEQAGVEVDEVEGEDSAEGEETDEDEGEESDEDEGEESEDEDREPFKFDDETEESGDEKIRDENSKKRKLGFESEGSEGEEDIESESGEEMEVSTLEKDEYGLAVQNVEEREIGVRKLYLSVIRSDDAFEPLRQLYANIAEENDEDVDDVPVQPSPFDPVSYFASEAFQANSIAGLYVADHDVWYSIPDVTVKGLGKEVGRRYLKEKFIHGNNQQQALTILQDGMVQACVDGGSGGTIRVCHIDRQNKITDIASDTLEDLQVSKQRRLS